MQARCQIRTSREQIEALPCPPSRQCGSSALRFLTDSKTLSSIPSPFDHTPLLIGPGRAFTGVPANLKVSTTEAARRDQR